MVALLHSHRGLMLAVAAACFCFQLLLCLVEASPLQDSGEASSSSSGQGDALNDILTLTNAISYMELLNLGKALKMQDPEAAKILLKIWRDVQRYDNEYYMASPKSYSRARDSNVNDIRMTKRMPLQRWRNP